MLAKVLANDCDFCPIEVASVASATHFVPLLSPCQLRCGYALVLLGAQRVSWHTIIDNENRTKGQLTHAAKVRLPLVLGAIRRHHLEVLVSREDLNEHARCVNRSHTSALDLRLEPFQELRCFCWSVPARAQ